MKILYVEDDRDLQEIVLDLLNDLFDLEIMTAHSGNNAIDILKTSVEMT